MAISSAPVRRPLAGVRVIDITDTVGAMCGRILADLGAEVVLVEPPAGLRSRQLAPRVDGMSLRFATAHANKTVVTLDLESLEGREELLQRAGTADILIDGLPAGRLSDLGLASELLRVRNPRLVVTAITPFGQTGPYRDYAGSEAVYFALSSVLSRSGLPGREPLVPPGRLADEHASAQAAWATLVAYWDGLGTGAGQDIDVSVLEAVISSMDPAFGIAGSAMADLRASDLPSGRPDARHLYPIFACRDGFVRICMLAPRQWRGMFRWLGEPEEFQDPKYDITVERFRARRELYKMIGEHFVGRTAAQLAEEGQHFGVPIEPVNTFADVLQSAHFAARGSFITLATPGGRSVRLPRGCLEVDEAPVGLGASAPPDAALTMQRDGPSIPSAASPSGAGAPLTGLRVLDLGVIVVGAETGRLFADLGADVIKVESSAFPDGSRQGGKPGAVTASVAWGHRNKRSLGIDLRNPRGRELFLRLVAASDVVASNFKPGTMASLGLDYATLKQANPGIVVIDSSALGNSGPASSRMGYGPLVRAFTGLTNAWRYDDDPAGFCDSITVYPDHTAARMGALAALALLIRRRQTGTGGTVSVTQAEVMLMQFAAEFGAQSLAPETVDVADLGSDDALSGVFPCRGQDQWCVVTIRDDDDWRALCGLMDADDLALDPAFGSAATRRNRQADIEKRLSAWTSVHSPDEVMVAAQAAGVPAAAMRRVNELLTDVHLVARRTFTNLHQPGLGDLPAERWPAIMSATAEAHLRPAPRQGADTRGIVAELLQLSDQEINSLITDEVLQECQP